MGSSVVGGLLKGFATGQQARREKETTKKYRDDLERMNQTIGRMQGGKDFQGPIRPLGSMRKGGRVKQTGAYLLHKGEEVLPAGRTAKRRKAARKSSRSCSRR